MRQLCLAVKFLHERNIVHGYINPETICVDSQGNCKVAARRLVIQRNCFTPEFKLGGRRGKEVDVYALGAVFYRMMFGVYPFAGVNDA